MAGDFDAGRFQLLWDGDLGRNLLIELNSEEQVVLPEGRWILGNHEGSSFVQQVRGGQQSVWCDDILQDLVFKDEDSETIYVIPRGLGDRAPMTLCEYHRRYTTTITPVATVGRSRPLQCKAFVHKQRRGGAFVWWSISGLHGQLFDEQSVSPQKWYQNWWVWWHKQLTLLGMEAEVHLRKAPPCRHVDELHDLRYMPNPSMSSYAAVHLLTRWGNRSKSRVEKNAGQVQAWRLCFDGFCKTFLTRERRREWSVYIDLAAAAIPGQPLSGLQKLRLPLDGEYIDLSPIVNMGCPDSVSLLRKSVPWAT